MNKPISSMIADLRREIANLEREYRQTDEEWRQVDVEYVRLKRLREELDVRKTELWQEIEWRAKELAALQEGIAHEKSA